MDLKKLKLGASTVVLAWSYKFKDKKSQIKELTQFINDMAESRIENENGADWEEYKEMGKDEVEDQLSGLQGKVNGKAVKDVFYGLLEDLDKNDIKQVQRGLKHSNWDGRDDWHYIYDGL